MGSVITFLNATLLPGGLSNTERSASKPGGAYMGVLGTTKDSSMPRATYV